MSIHGLWKKPSYLFIFQRTEKLQEVTWSFCRPPTVADWNFTVNISLMMFLPSHNPLHKSGVEIDLTLLLEKSPSSDYHPCVSWLTYSYWTMKDCVKNTHSRGKLLLTAYHFQLSETARLCQSLHCIQTQETIFCRGLNVSILPCEPSRENATQPSLALIQGEWIRGAIQTVRTPDLCRLWGHNGVLF